MRIGNPSSSQGRQVKVESLGPSSFSLYAVRCLKIDFYTCKTGDDDSLPIDRPDIIDLHIPVGEVF
jgi:hypothetical protein